MEDNCVQHSKHSPSTNITKIIKKLTKYQPFNLTASRCTYCYLLINSFLVGLDCSYLVRSCCDRLSGTEAALRSYIIYVCISGPLVGFILLFGPNLRGSNFDYFLATEFDEL